MKKTALPSNPVTEARKRKADIATVESIVKQAMKGKKTKLIFKAKIQCHKCKTILPVSVKLDKEKFING